MELEKKTKDMLNRYIYAYLLENSLIKSAKYFLREINCENLNTDKLQKSLQEIFSEYVKLNNMIEKKSSKKDKSAKEPKNDKKEKSKSVDENTTTNGKVENKKRKLEEDSVDSNIDLKKDLASKKTKKVKTECIETNISNKKEKNPKKIIPESIKAKEESKLSSSDSDSGSSSSSDSSSDSSSGSDSDSSSSDSSSDSDSSDEESEDEEERLKKRQIEIQKKAIEAEKAALEWLKSKENSPSTKKTPQSEKDRRRSSGEAFRRVDDSWSSQIINGLEDNSYENQFGSDGYGAKANSVLVNVRGKDFRHEKTKKKRGSYRGGSITLASNSFKYEDE